MLRLSADGRSPGWIIKWEAVTEVVGRFLKSHETNTWLSLPVVDQTFEHKKYLGTPRNIRVKCDRQNGVVEFAIHPVELIAPEHFNVARADKAMRVW